MIIEISIGVIALAFVILVIYVIKTLQRLHKTVRSLELNSTLFMKETTDLIKIHQDIANNINQKLQKTDPLFEVVENVATRAQNLMNRCENTTYKICQCSHCQSHSEQNEKSMNERTIRDIVEILFALRNLYKKF